MVTGVLTLKNNLSVKHPKMVEKLKALSTKASIAFLTLQTAVVVASAEEDDVFKKAESMMGTIYSKIAGIASVTAGCLAAVCIFIMIFSKTQRNVDESIAWLKRIAIGWIAIMIMPAILVFFKTGLGIGKAGSITTK